jgi:autotransporter-associated beta strand protein
VRNYSQAELHQERLLIQTVCRDVRTLVLAGGLLTISAAGAWAQNAAWQPVPTVAGPAAGTFDFNANPNWVPATVPTGTATFSVTTGPNLSFSAASTSIGTMQFNAGAPAYTFSLTSDHAVNVNGAGIVNNSSNKPIFSVDASNPVSVTNFLLNFNNGASAGDATINVANGAIVQFFGTSTAANATITLSTAGSLIFNDSSSAGSATIHEVSGGFDFKNSSTAGDATITTGADQDAFENTSTAANAHITIPTGSIGLVFVNASSGGSAAIDNAGAGVPAIGLGSLIFTSSSTATDPTVRTPSAANATITNHDGGELQFGTYTLTFSPLFNFDFTKGTGSAGNATIINNNGGTTTFLNQSDAGTATITNNSGGSLLFVNKGGLPADPDASGARVINNAGGKVDISGVTTGVSIGSIEGAGNVFLGSKKLTLGNSNLNTEISGVIADGGASGGVGGSLTKVGTGTLILSGANTYTGGTTISAGTLQLGNGGTTGSIVGNVLDNGIFAINHSNAFLYNGVISGSGAFQQIGAGTTTLTAVQSYSGLTTIGAGTLALTGAGSVASSSGVVDNATFDISATGSGASIKTLSGSGIVALGAKTLTLTNASGNFTGAIGGAGGFTLAGGAEMLSGSNTYTGPTTISGGTLTIAAGGGITSNVTNAATFNNSGAVAGSVGNSGTFTNNAGGTVSGQLTNTAGTTTNAGQLNGGATVSGGTLTNNNLISGAVGISGGTLNNNAAITGTVASAATFNNNAGGTVSGQLTNTAGTTTNAGHLNGGANVTGGTLTTTGVISGGLTNSATVNAAGIVNGPIANNASSFTTTGTLASNSTFANAAGATLAVGTATYTLQGLLTNSGAVTVANGATLDASAGGITNNAGGSITVAAGGTVKDDLNNAGVVSNNGAYVANVATNTGAGSITNTATGTWTGNILSNAATITNSGVWTGNVVSNTGTLTNNLTWTGTVSNAGAFNNNAGATVSGLLTNTAGTTTNNGALNGGANVSGGTFTGSGTVTNLTVSGGTFAPGNSTPGSSMTVSGNLALQSGAMYLVTLNPTTSTFTNVGGTASLNGTAAAVYLAGNYISKKYTILTAAGGVAGTFGSLVNTNVPANFSSTLSYDANNAYINLVLNFVPNPAPNFGPGLNINQQNVANALVNFFNATGGIPLAFGTLTPAGLTQVSGELGTGIIQTAIKADDLFLNLLLDPSVAGRAGGFASSPAASQFAEDEEALAYAAKRKASSAEREAYAMATKAPYLAPQPVNRWSVWGAAYGGSAKVDGNTIVGSHDLNARVWGVVGGADYKVTPDALVGFALAGGGTNYSLSDALGNGRSDLFQAGLFGRQNIGAAYLSAALAYGWHDVTTNRTAAVPGGDVLQARFRAETFSGRFEGGYRIATAWAGLTPYVAAQAISFHLPGYAEQTLGGLGTFALNYAGQTTTATRTELGARSDRSWAMQEGVFTLRGRAAWAHDYNNDRAVTAVFQALPGASFVVNGARANPDGALVSAGAEMKWRSGFSLAATFEGEFSGNTTSYAGKGVAKYSW